MVRFSVIMPSFLGEYENAAKNRDEKIHRAVTSLVRQDFENWELLVISDGCDATIKQMQPYVDRDPRIRLITINRQKLFSGRVRNAGIYYAVGEYVVYLDIDDFLGVNHLSKIDSGIHSANEPAWVYFNDWLASDQNSFSERVCEINRRYKCGTSNLAHKRELNVFWRDESYLHDWILITDLSDLHNGIRIPTAEYMVCHFPPSIDV